MTQIKDYILLLAGACLTCGGLTILAPSGNFERIIRLIGSVFLLLCMLLPLGNMVYDVLDYSWMDSIPDQGDLSNDAWEYSAAAMEQAMTNTINEYVLTVTGREAKAVDVEISINEQKFTMTGIEIILDRVDSNKTAAVADYIAVKTGMRPSVISG